MNNDCFKVRIWNVSGGYYLPDFYLTPAGEVCEFGVFNGEGRVRKFADQENFIKERCTGLTDKNGRLIYEGDVVRYYRSTAMGLGGERIASVLWDVESAKFKILTKKGDGYSMWEANRMGIEIIGNIHKMEVCQ